MKMNKSTTYFPESSDDVSFTATPDSFTVPADIYIMRVIADQDCVITWPGDSGSAKIPAGIPEYFGVHPETDLSVVRDTTDGTLSVSWMTN